MASNVGTGRKQKKDRSDQAAGCTHSGERPERNAVKIFVVMPIGPCAGEVSGKQPDAIRGIGVKGRNAYKNERRKRNECAAARHRIHGPGDKRCSN